MKWLVMACAFFVFGHIAFAKSNGQKNQQSEKTNWKDNLGIRVGGVTNIRTSDTNGTSKMSEGLLMKAEDQHLQAGVFIGYQPGLWGVQLTLGSSVLAGDRGSYETFIELSRDTYQLTAGAEFEPFGNRRFVPIVKVYLGPTYSEYQYKLKHGGKIEVQDEDSNFGAISGVQFALPFARHFSMTLGYELEIERIELRKIEFKADDLLNHKIAIGGYYEI